MPEGILASTEPTQPEGAKQKAHEGVLSWAADNILHPALNVAAVQPYDAAANIVDKVTTGIIGKKILPEWKPFEVKQAGMGSTEWFTQNLSSGLAMVVPYGLAGKAAGGLMRSAGETMGAEGAMARFLQNEKAATILGAAAYDGARTPGNGETRLGNALGGAAGFSVFMGGNAWSHGFEHMSDRLLARSLTGMVGSMTQTTVSEGVAQGKLPTFEQLSQSAITGGMMNVALPAVQDGMSKAVDHVNVKLGRGIPVDRFVQSHMEPYRAETLDRLLDENPWTRVQPSHESTANPRTNRVSLAEYTPDELAHELAHISAARQLQTQAGYQNAAEQLRSGNVEASWNAFRDTRLQQELYAELSGHSVRAEQKGSTALPDAQVIAADLPTREAKPGVTYEQLWRQEFEQFRDSGGVRLPEKEYSGFNKHDSRAWFETLSQFDTLPQEERVDAIKNLQFAPDSARSQFWYKAIRSQDTELRKAAVESLDKLPPRHRLAAWLEQTRSQFEQTRVASTENLGSLPSDQRGTAFKHLLMNKPVLQPEAPEGRANKRPDVPAERTDKLIASLDSLPQSKTFEYWMLAFRNPWTSEAAARNIEVLPEYNRLNAWETVYNSRNPKNINALYSGISALNEMDRVPSWEKLENAPRGYNVYLDGQSVAKGLTSLPIEPQARFDYWLRMVDSVTGGLPRDTYGSSIYSRVHNTGYWRTSDRGLVDSLQGLPDEQRLQGFQAIYERVNRDSQSMGALYTGVRYLPEESRVGAWQTLLQHPMPDQYVWHFNMTKVPPSHLPDLTETVMSLPDGAGRNALLTNMPVEMIDDAPLHQRMDALRATYETAFANARPGDFEHIRNWWSVLPDVYDENVSEAEQQYPVRKYLSQTLDPRYMARMMFRPEHQHIADSLAIAEPDVVRSLMRKASWLGGEKGDDMSEVASVWLNTGSLESAARRAVAVSGPRENKWEDPGLAPVLVSELAPRSNWYDVQDTMRTMRQVITEHPSAEPEQMARQDMALSIASRLSKNFPELYQQEFLDPVEKALGDTNYDYGWRLKTARDIASLQREGQLGDVHVKMPDLRMPRAIELSPEEQNTYRQRVEDQLYDGQALRDSLRGGDLSRLFPTVFGNYAEHGGIVDRPQHGGHAFQLDEHTLRVVDEVRNHPQFEGLSAKDQVNLMWAALMHDVGKRPGRPDPDHEQAGANISWGVLRSLGYPVQRIQRIANLINRHSEMSYLPERSPERFKDEAKADDIAAFYRHPSALRQLLIMNESDIRSLNEGQSYWRPEVEASLNRDTGNVLPHVKRFNSTAVPVLTSELPTQFKLQSLQGDYAVLAHASPYLDGAFTHQLALIESPEYSASTSLLTPEFKQLYHDRAPLVALLAGPPEQISQAYRSNLGTGTGVDWQEHVKLTKDWTESARGTGFANELNSRLQNSPQMPRPTSLSSLWHRLGQYDTRDEVLREAGPTSVEWRGLQQVTQALTTEADGGKLHDHNEIKINNPTVVGFGIIRRGAPVYIENIDRSNLNALLAGEQQPSWLITDANNVPPNAVRVPENVWQAARDRNLPLVVLDP